MQAGLIVWWAAMLPAGRRQDKNGTTSLLVNLYVITDCYDVAVVNVGDA